MGSYIYGLPGLNGSNGGFRVSETPAQLLELFEDRDDYVLVNRNSDGQDVYINRASVAFFADDSWTHGSG